MARLLIAIAALFFAGVPILAHAQAPFGLSLDRIGEVQPGTYLAGDNVRFTLNSNGDTYLLRFDGSPEIYVLYTGHASLGGRVLKYDSGETAMQVAGWGGITLYTDTAPTGLPAERTGDAAPAPALPGVSLGDIQKAANDEMEHLAYMRGLRMTVSADWNALANNSDMRALAFDAMENAVRGLDRFSYSAAGREALSRHVDTLRIAAADKPTLTLKLKSLIVTFDPNRGYEGRASSRAIARALGQIFPKK